MPSPQIFISYAQDQSHGQRLARAVQKQLLSAGYQVFRDESNVTAGTHWAMELERQLEASQLLVLVMSEKVRSSNWVMAEFDLAKELGIPVIPVQAELVRCPLWLRHLQMLDFSVNQDWGVLLKAISHHINSLDMILDDDGISQTSLVPASRKTPKHISEKPVWASQAGEDKYGQFADLIFQNIRQRFRLIPAGQFMMGSPKSEKERWDAAEDYHQVSLSKAFWLADTTCTQAMWQTVMNNNPSHFSSDDNNPVENVSWDDTQGFIEKINQSIQGSQLSLPSEAQWEYACRAGTSSPFHIGENITPDQVNYDGNFPYNGAKQGQYRKKTVAVKSMPSPNAWGLHEMHGNVWEWCQDLWKESLGTASVTDPLNLEAGDSRMIRGGSWDSLGRRVRSAYRFRGSSDMRSYRVGFRLSLGR